MAFLGIQVPVNAGQLLSQIDVPGEKSPTSELHITLLYLEGKRSISELSKCLEVIHKITDKAPPFLVKTSQVTHFPGWGDKDEKCAVIAKVISPELHHFRGQLADAFDRADIDFSKKFRGYKPHITLSYSEKEPKDFSIDPVQFMVSEIKLWCGEEMDDRMIITFPLQIKQKHALLWNKVDVFEKLAYQIPSL